jgi:diacylglycerol kinase family enzyme
MIHGISCKFNFAIAEARDVGILSFIDNEGREQKKYWLINASIGITAEANLFFNTPDFILNYLKKTRTNSAILYAALRTIVSYRNRKITVKIGNNKSKKINLTNMGVVKSPHFSGNFSYNTPFETDNGQFYINICRDMHLLNMLYLLWNLSKNRFRGLPKTESFCSDCLTAESDQQFAIEFDGEVIATKCAIIKMKQKMIEVCTC